MRTPRSFRELDGEVFVDEAEDLLCLWRADFDGRRTPDLRHGYLLREGALWRREGGHTEYAHDPDALRQRCWKTPASRRSRCAPTAPRAGTADFLSLQKGTIDMDKILHAVAGDGFIKMAVIVATDAAEKASRIHACSPTAAAALGRALAAASLLGESMKEDGAVLTLRIDGGGPVGRVVKPYPIPAAICAAMCQSRGRSARPGGRQAGCGRSGREKRYAHRQPGHRPGRSPISAPRSWSPARSPRISPPICWRASRCPRPAVWVCSSIRTNPVKAAGGFLVQLMPGAPDALAAKLER